MEINATPSRYADRDGERGGGGKFKKPPARKPPATPYDRPQSNQTGRAGWLLKLAEPAYRIISNRILPSFISNAISGTPPPLELINDEEDPARLQDLGNEEKHTSSYAMSRSAEGKEGNPSVGKLTGISEVEKLEEEKLPSSSDNTEISQIEQLMQGKTFSRDEIMRLTEILNSKVIDEQDNKVSRTAERDTGRFHLTHETPRRPIYRKQDDTDSAMPVIDEQDNKVSRTAEGGDTGRFHLTHETPRRPIYRKQDDTDSAVPGTSTTNVQDEVGASPIDIARAYMGSRRLERKCDSYGFVSKVEQAQQNRFIHPASPKSSTFWPAAMAQDHRGYITPQNQRGNGLVDFPRTPYSRTLLPKTTDRTQALAANQRLDLSAKPFQQSQSSIYSQEKTRTDLRNLSHGSVGPIRRIRDKIGSESRPRRSIFLNPTNASSSSEKIGASKVFLPAVGKKLEVGETSGVSKCQSVEYGVGTSEEVMPLRSSSNETVRKILAQLDRHKPTPTEKAAELKLASEWKKYTPSEVSDATPSGKMRSSHLGEFGVRRDNGLVTAKSSKEGDIGTVSHVELSQEQTRREADTVTDASAKASSAAVTSSLTFRATADSQIKSFFPSSHSPSLQQDSVGTDNGQKDKGATPQWPFGNQSNGNATTLSNSTASETRRNAPGQASGTRPKLPSIFVNKPNPGKATLPDNGFGFTFPVPASSNALSEPPTPSITPSPSARALPQPVDAPAVPVYSFGSGKSAERLVFSFPSTSNASIPVDAPDLKFSFGADNKSRLSFSAVGKASC